MRISKRDNDQKRDTKIETNVNLYAEGSCLISVGNTKVLCTASVDENVPRWMKGTNKGWVTAEYGMLPRSTHGRMSREAAKGKQSGRTVEISRLIGRSLRAVVDLNKLGERQITLDCDVIQADGGTRTAAITGAFVALHLAIQKLMMDGLLKDSPVSEHLAAVSCGVINNDGENIAVLDLDYAEDSTAIADANFIFTETNGIVEIQATAEDVPFSEEQLDAMKTLAKKGISELVQLQKQAITGS